MSNILRRAVPASLLLILLVIVLSACSNDCPSCNGLRDDGTLQTIDVQLCGSEVPDPDVSERICTEITNVTYTFVKGEETP